MPKFEFISEGHKYLLDDRELLSVTSVLPYNYRGNNTEAMLKGRYIHEMCRLYLLKNLDEGNLDSALVPYLDAFRKFLYEIKGMDIMGVFDIKSGSPHPCTELQISAYIELVNHGIPQSAPEGQPILEMPFYHSIYSYGGTPDIIIFDKLPVREGYALYLKDNGKYSLSSAKDVRKNFEIFIHHLNAYKWQKEKGLI